MNYCTECGRGYEESYFAELCEFLDSGRAFDCPHSPFHMGRSVHALQKAVRSIAVEEPREVFELTEDYRVVRQDTRTWVEQTTDGRRWSGLVPVTTRRAILAAFYADADCSTWWETDNTVSETQDATEGRK